MLQSSPTRPASIDQNEIVDLQHSGKLLKESVLSTGVGKVDTCTSAAAGVKNT